MSISTPLTSVAVAAAVAVGARGGSVVRVDSRAAGENPDGATWSGAYAHPQAAVDAARPGDEVWVAEGRYGPGPRGVVVELAPGVRLYGGFGGYEPRREYRDPASHRTVLDGRAFSARVVTAASVCGAMRPPKES